ncbi:MAG: ABC transporter substrate-binding protein [Actinomycetota bacterium]|nr:ABC transporter substrate-binding protein [Actinomycetota bacterium]
MNKPKKIMIFAFTLILMFTNIFLCSCEYNNLGLVTIDDETGSVNEKDDTDNPDVSSREFFLELKEKQKNKNPLDDINVRKAIFYAIDREKIVDELLGEYGEVLDSLFSKDSYYYYPAWSEYDYDINKAKEFLSKAGYGVDNPLYITIGSVSDNNARQVIEEMIIEDLEKIGIELWIFNKPSKEWYQDYVEKGDYELGIWSIYNFDGSSLFYNFDSGKIPPLKTEENKNCENFYWYENLNADEILKKIKEENDPEVKKDLLRNLQDLLVQDAVVLPLYSRLFSVAYNNKKLKKIDIDIKNNKIFFNIENWILSNKENSDENGKNEIIIGYEGEDYEFSGPFDQDYISSLVMKGLWQINEKGECEAVLVEENDYSYENANETTDLEIDVTLKDEIFWEDGDPITSEDVKYTYESILGNEDLDIDEDYSKLKAIEVINEKEFKIIFKEYINNWKKLFQLVLKKGSLDEKNISDLSPNDIIANGPYKIEDYKERKYLTLVKNEFYSVKNSEKASEIDSISVIFDVDINNLVGMLRDGDIDLLNIPVDLDLMESLEENEDFDLLVKPGSLLEHLAICLKPKEK